MWSSMTTQKAMLRIVGPAWTKAMCIKDGNWSSLSEKLGEIDSRI